MSGSKKKINTSKQEMDKSSNNNQPYPPLSPTIIKNLMNQGYSLQKGTNYQFKHSHPYAPPKSNNNTNTNQQSNTNSSSINLGNPNSNKSNTNNSNYVCFDPMFITNKSPTTATIFEPNMHPNPRPTTITPSNAQSYLNLVKDDRPTLWCNEAKQCIQIATPKTITNPNNIITHLPYNSSLLLNKQPTTHILFKDIPNASIQVLNHQYPLNEFIVNFSNLDNSKPNYYSAILAGLPFRTSTQKGTYYGPNVTLNMNDASNLSRVGPALKRNALVCNIYIYIIYYILSTQLFDRSLERSQTFKCIYTFQSFTLSLNITYSMIECIYTFSNLVYGNQ